MNETDRTSPSPTSLEGLHASVLPDAYATALRTGVPVRVAAEAESGLHLPRMIALIRAGAEVLGYCTVVLPAGDAAQQICGAALEEAVRLMALAVLHERATRADSRLARGTLLLDLLGGAAPVEVLATRADRLRIELSGKLALGLVSIASEERPERALARATSLLPGRVAPLVDIVGEVLVLLCQGGSREVALGQLSALARQTRSVAVLSRSTGAGGLPRAYQEARRALDVAARGGRHGVVDVENLGILGILLGGEEAPVQALLRARLDGLLAYDRREGTDLCGSLAAYFEEGGVRPAARRLGIHHNSLAYRLERAQVVGGFSLDDVDERLTMALALRCRELLS